MQLYNFHNVVNQRVFASVKYIQFLLLFIRMEIRISMDYVITSLLRLIELGKLIDSGNELEDFALVLLSVFTRTCQ